MEQQAPIYVQIISPERVLFEGMVSVIRFPGQLSPFTVLYNHAPLISSLSEGPITYETDSGVKGSIAIKDGFVQINQNKVYVCITQEE